MAVYTPEPQTAQEGCALHHPWLHGPSLFKKKAAFIQKKEKEKASWLFRGEDLPMDHGLQLCCTKFSITELHLDIRYSSTKFSILEYMLDIRYSSTKFSILEHQLAP
jgi:hypothetical protein